MKEPTMQERWHQMAANIQDIRDILDQGSADYYSEIVVYKHKDSLNAKLFPVSGEVNTLPSETIPDQSMTIHEILRRFAAGLPMEGQRVPLYDEDDGTDPLDRDFVDPRTLDLAELEALEQNLKLVINEQKARYEQQRKQPANEGAGTTKEPVESGS